jgi:YbbR domain-containing protein
VVDETNGSGINLSTLTVKVDGVTIPHTTTAITNGYAVTATPTTALTDGAHTVTVNVSDIRLTVRVWMIKELPVEIIIKDGGGLTASDVTATPSRDSIMVSGSEAALRGLDKIELLVDLSLLTESKVLEFAIELPEDVTNESGISKVEVDVKVPEMTTKVLVIPKDQFVLLNVPEGMSAAPLTEALRVVIRGRENRLEDVTVDNITVYIDFKDAVAGPNYYNCTVEISGVEDVGVVYGENEYRVLAIVSLVFQEAV